MDLSNVVDLNRYPITEVDSTIYTSLLERTRGAYIRDGIVILPGFLTSEAIQSSVTEVLSAKGEEWLTNSTHNVFLDKGDLNFDQNHIRYSFQKEVE